MYFTVKKKTLCILLINKQIWNTKHILNKVWKCCSVPSRGTVLSEGQRSPCVLWAQPSSFHLNTARISKIHLSLTQHMNNNLRRILKRTGSKMPICRLSKHFLRGQCHQRFSAKVQVQSLHFHEDTFVWRKKGEFPTMPRAPQLFSTHASLTAKTAMSRGGRSYPRKKSYLH